MRESVTNADEKLGPRLHHECEKCPATTFAELEKGVQQNLVTCPSSLRSREHSAGALQPDCSPPCFCPVSSTKSAPHATVYILHATPATGRVRHLSTLSVPTHAPSSNVRPHALPARVHLRTNHIMQGGTSHPARSASLVDFCRAICRAAGTI